MFIAVTHRRSTAQPLLRAPEEVFNKSCGRRENLRAVKTGAATAEGIHPLQGHAAIREFWDAAITRALAADVHLVGDGGGKAPQWGTGVIAGAENVARVLASLVPPFAQIGGVVQPHVVNGQPGAIFRDRDGRVINTWALDILDGQIQTIRTVINPDKLGHVGPVADAWAVAHEVNQARRPTAR